MRDAAKPSPGPKGVPQDLLDILVCPLGHAELKLEGDRLICTRCGPRFKILDGGIPDMIIEDAELPEGTESIEDLECMVEKRRQEKKN